jgi:mono/diheme cytochrome c family protein
VDAKDMAPLSGLVVKSLITRPLEGAVLAPGRVAIAGFAWAGEQDITRVDVSPDGGATWQAARLVGPRIRFAWRRFEHAFEGLAPGARVLLSRATDARGRVQPLVPAWNPPGYLWNAPDSVSIDVREGAVAPAGAADLRPLAAHDQPDAAATGKAIYERACLACHDGGLVEAQRLSPAAWRRSIAKMVQWGARVEPAEAESLSVYLASRWGPP